MTTLPFDAATVRGRIFHLPSRPPLMLAADLAEFYGTSTKRIGEQVRRNPERFPERFAMTLTEAELNRLRAHFATANARINKTRYEPLALTEKGSLALSGVLKTPRAAEVSVLIIDAFVDYREAEHADLKDHLARARCDWLARRPRRLRWKELALAGRPFREIAAERGSVSIHALATDLREMFWLGLIPAVPFGTPAPDMTPAQGDLFTGA